MKEDAYLLCKLIDGVYVPQTAPVVLTGSDLNLDGLKGLASENGLVLVVLKAK